MYLKRFQASFFKVELFQTAIYNTSIKKWLRCATLSNILRPFPFQSIFKYNRHGVVLIVNWFHISRERKHMMFFPSGSSILFASMPQKHSV